MPMTRHCWLGRPIVLIGLACLLSACEPPPPGRDLLANIRHRGELIIATRVNPTTYYTERDQVAGIEYELASEFARDIGVKLTIEPAANISQVFTLLNNGEVDIAAAGLSVTPQKRALYT